MPFYIKNFYVSNLDSKHFNLNMGPGLIDKLLNHKVIANTHSFLFLFFYLLQSMNKKQTNNNEEN